MSLEESRKAEGRIKRRFARFKNHEHLVTRDPLMAELMLAQIDATLSVSHAVQEFGEKLEHQLDEVHWTVLKDGVPPFGAKAKYEAHIGALEADMRGLQGKIDNLERHISDFSGALFRSTTLPEPSAPHQPWWAFWRGW